MSLIRRLQRLHCHCSAHGRWKERLWRSRCASSEVGNNGDLRKERCAHSLSVMDDIYAKIKVQQDTSSSHFFLKTCVTTEKCVFTAYMAIVHVLCVYVYVCTCVRVCVCVCMCVCGVVWLTAHSLTIMTSALSTGTCIVV